MLIIQHIIKDDFTKKKKEEEEGSVKKENWKNR